jgi:sigma-E factor negative regulatory protein RseC
MEEVGIVTKIEGITAYITVERKSACEHCTAGTCKMSTNGANLEAINEAGAVVGQTVRVAIKDFTYMSGSLFFYGVPAMALMAGAILGLYVFSGMIPKADPEAVAAITSFVCLGLSLIIVKLWSRSAERKSVYQPVVVEVLESK